MSINVNSEALRVVTTAAKQHNTLMKDLSQGQDDEAAQLLDTSIFMMEESLKKYDEKVDKP